MPRSLPVRLKFRLPRIVVIVMFAAAAFGLALIQRGDARVQTAQPRIVIAGWTLTAESCAMPDGLIEPGEPVTLSIALQNTGAVNTGQQLMATLQATGGVTSPSADNRPSSANSPSPPPVNPSARRSR